MLRVTRTMPGPFPWPNGVHFDDTRAPAVKYLTRTLPLHAL